MTNVNAEISPSRSAERQSILWARDEMQAIECRHSRGINRSHKRDAKGILRPKILHDVWRGLPCQAPT